MVTVIGKMDKAIRVQILFDIVCILHSANLTIVSPAMNK